jgi:hypothetical protein
MTFVKALRDVFTFYLVSLYVTSPIFLAVIVKLFLNKLKSNAPNIYKRAKVARTYVAIIAVSLVLRGLSIVFDFIVGHIPNSSNKAWWTINDIQLIAFYFIETVPSIIIIVVLWKSYKNTKKLTVSQEFLFPEERIHSERY